MADTTFFSWMSYRPHILFHASGDQNDVGHYLPDEKIYRFVFDLWHTSVDDIVAYHQQWKSLRPQHRLFHVVNEFTIGRQVAARGVPVVYAHQNCLLDETVFNIHFDVVRTFDAVYNGRMAEFKRHELLTDVPNSLIIGGIVTWDDSQERFDEVKRMLPHATFTHGEDNQHLISEEVACALSSARVGVCLSAVEGGMYAATEYLLCGLPVVSTPSLGGRDAWFDPRFTRVVPPRPDAVAAAVQELIDLDLDPRFVRNETMSRMVEHRRVFCDAVQEIYLAEEIGRDFTRDFYTNFRNKGGNWRYSKDVLEGFNPA
ncbi:MAG: glycosyltransferase [Planctomycetaceae bacterium]|nr:glycosyltransferase [Planctomycetaceae bacterium]MCB9952325.1 glycosyltransferase [Planctomycetaceae bacterium]